MSRFEEFIKGMEAVHGPIYGVSLSEKDFPPLPSNPMSTSPSQRAASLSAASPSSSSPNQAGPASILGASGLHGVVQPDAHPPSNWSSLFHSDQAAKLQSHKPLVANGKPSVFIPKSIHKLGFTAWEDCLVGQFLGVYFFLSNLGCGPPALGSA